MNRNAALIYVRVSRLDDEERDRKLSPAMQREKALALRELTGLKTIEYADLDISGKDTAHRPQYLAMLDRMSAADVKYVVAYDLSRITRSVRDQADFFETLHRHGALFIESQSGRTIDPTDEDEELGANVLGSVNQHYRRKTARRVRDTLATKVARGELVGPVRPATSAGKAYCRAGPSRGRGSNRTPSAHRSSSSCSSCTPPARTRSRPSRSSSMAPP